MPGCTGAKKPSIAVLATCTLAIFTLISCSLSVYARQPLNPARTSASETLQTEPFTPRSETKRSDYSDKLFSPSVGQIFYEIAYEIGNSQDTDRSQIEQALVLLTASTELGNKAGYVLSDMINLASQYSPGLNPLDPNAAQAQDSSRSEIINDLLIKYVDESADLEVARKGIRYLLEQLNSREDREQLLTELLKTPGGKNDALYSELATLLGLLTAEKADMEAAQSYFMQAYDKNKYNKLAFEKLAELAPEQTGPAIRLEQLRLTLATNPLDIETALNFAGYAEQLQLYDTAADAYEYSAKLFAYLYPSQTVPASIYLPSAISCYNTQRNQLKCLQIAKTIRQNGRFDLLLEAIAGKAAAKTGNPQEANQILQTAQEKALQLLTEANSHGPTADQFAWFSCFALPDADKALYWANKAYSAEPNSVTAASILAYSLVMNGQPGWAKPLIDGYQRTQISDLAMAQVQLSEEQRDAAIGSLKSAIAKDPGSLEAERAKEILAQNGGDYIPPTDPDIILTVLQNSFGRSVVPAFTSPDKIISVQLNIRGSKFSYGDDFGGTIVITNNSSEPLVISDDGLLKGNIRIDANVSGDLRKNIPNLVSIKIQPSLPIKPAANLLIPVRLINGELKKMLLTYPQASLDIKFTVFIDPVTTDKGVLADRLADIKPTVVSVKRSAIELTRKFLQNRFDSLSAAKQGQSRTAQLFIGLLMEQNALANREPPYKFMYADWIPKMLKSALRYSLTGDDWVLRVNTMSGMLSLPMDYETVNAASENLNDAHWPVRLMTLYLLAKTQGAGFSKVLNHYAQYESNRLVRDMAIALGASVPAVREPAGQPEPNSPK